MAAMEMAAIPPMTPPAMAPAFELLGLGVDVPVNAAAEEEPEKTVGLGEVPVD
jgi:hypothetical protein